MFGDSVQNFSQRQPARIDYQSESPSPKTKEKKMMMYMRECTHLEVSMDNAVEM